MKIACSDCGELKNAPASRSSVLCHPCRKRRKHKSCHVCGASFEARYLAQDACSLECGQALAKERRPVVAAKDTRTCEGCKEEFTPNRKNRPQKFCSRKCGVSNRKPRLRTDYREVTIIDTSCIECGSQYFYIGTHRRYCSDECSRVSNSRRTCQRILSKYHSDSNYRDEVIARAHARRADKLGLGSAKVTLSHLIERDEGICGICNQVVTDTTGPMKPSLDHVIPLSRGGEHSMPNVQLSHYRCNLSKGNKLQSELTA